MPVQFGRAFFLNVNYCGTKVPLLKIPSFSQRHGEPLKKTELTTTRVQLNGQKFQLTPLNVKLNLLNVKQKLLKVKLTLLKVKQTLLKVKLKFVITCDTT